MKSVSRTVLIALAFAVAVIVANSLFIVDETEQVIVLQFGEQKETHTEPGLKFKVPFIQKHRVL